MNEQLGNSRIIRFAPTELPEDVHTDEQRQQRRNKQARGLDAGGDDRVPVSLLGQLPPFLFELVTSSVDGGPLLIELTSQALLRRDHLGSGFRIALDKLLGGFRQLLALLDNGLALASNAFILPALLLPASFCVIGKPLVAHVWRRATADRGQQCKYRQGHAGQPGSLHGHSSNG